MEIPTKMKHQWIHKFMTENIKNPTIKMPRIRRQRAKFQRDIVSLLILEITTTIHRCLNQELMSMYRVGTNYQSNQKVWYSSDTYQTLAQAKSSVVLQINKREFSGRKSHMNRR